MEHNISYQPCKFQLSRMSGSNLTEAVQRGVENTHPPKCCTGRKKTSAFRVNDQDILKRLSPRQNSSQTPHLRTKKSLQKPGWMVTSQCDDTGIRLKLNSFFRGGHLLADLLILDMAGCASSWRVTNTTFSTKFNVFEV